MTSGGLTHSIEDESGALFYVVLNDEHLRGNARSGDEYVCCLVGQIEISTGHHEGHRLVVK
jgi:hypothetical protein